MCVILRQKSAPSDMGKDNTVSPLPNSEVEIRERCRRLLHIAGEEALRLRHDFIGAEHLFIALTQLNDSLTYQLLVNAGQDPRMLRGDIRRDAGTYDAPVVFKVEGDFKPEEQLPFTPRCQRILTAALAAADGRGEDEINELHILMGLLTEGAESLPMRRLHAAGVSLEDWRDEVKERLEYDDVERLTNPFNVESIDFTSHERSPFNPFGERTLPFSERSRTAQLSTAGSETPLLNKFGRDLTLLAQKNKLSPVVGREREIRAVARTLTRNKKNNPLLLGDAGVGKTAVVEGLAIHIASNKVPASLANKRIIQIEVGTLLAGTSLRGQFEERLVGLLEEAKTAGNIILFIDEMHTIVGAGDTIDSNLDAANILKPALSRGEITCIGATTHEEYRKAIAQDSALERRFRTIDVDEPSPEETRIILGNVEGQYAKHHQVLVTPDALDAAVSLSNKYMINRRQPDKALDLLDEACARVAMHRGDQQLPLEVQAEVIAEVVAEWTGIPVSQITEDERRRYQTVGQALLARVIGQDEAVHVVADAIKTNRAGLSDPRRPVGVFLFLGPSGVGKTELAKALANFLFGTEDALLRFDMSEFYDEHTVARLIGSPPGYKDSQRGGQLTEALRRRPYSVILLDEVEKAAPEVFDIFLQVFDDGRLSDGRGGTVDARHAVWIMTSNIGTAEGARGGYGFKADSVSISTHQAAYQAALKKFFRPEFLNRIDEVIIFNPLTEAVLMRILDLQMAEVRARLSKQQLSLEITAEARAALLSQGYDPVNGARPLRRAIERMLLRPLSNALLESPWPPNTTIYVTAKPDGKLGFAGGQPA
jgi:ATP-dependent Clp protease ATP-binding subunit ClpC